MTVLSLLRSSKTPSVVAKLFGSGTRLALTATAQPFRLISTSVVKYGGGHERTMTILPSKFQWQKYKDLLHFYTFLGAIPLLALVFYTNVFIGPATLSEIPCGYEPKHWEYYRHPITRFMSRYLCTMHQETYERNLHYMKEMEEEKRMTALTRKVERLMQERGDYPNHYSSKIVFGKYIRSRVIEDRRVEENRGDN